MERNVPQETGTNILDLDLTSLISNGKTSTKLFDKRDDCSFLLYAC